MLAIPVVNTLTIEIFCFKGNPFILSYLTQNFLTRISTGSTGSILVDATYMKPVLNVGFLHGGIHLISFSFA